MPTVLDTQTERLIATYATQQILRKLHLVLKYLKAKAEFCLIRLLREANSGTSLVQKTEMENPIL